LSSRNELELSYPRLDELTMHSIFFLLTLAADLIPQSTLPLAPPTLQLGFEAGQSPSIAFHRQGYVAIFPTHLRVRSLGIDIHFRNANANPSPSFNSPLPGLVREYPLGQPQPHYQSIELRNLYPGFLTQFTYSPIGQVNWRITCQTSTCNWSALEFEVPTTTSLTVSSGSLSISLNLSSISPVFIFPGTSQGRFTSKGPRTFGIEPGPNQAFEVRLTQFEAMTSNRSNFASFALPDPLDKPASYPSQPFRGCFRGAVIPSPCLDPALARFSPNGDLLWLTVLHGNRGEILDSLVISPAGALYLSGRTASSNFPTTAGAFQTLSAHSPTDSLPSSFAAAPTDLFLARLQPSDGALLASTLLGGPEPEEPMVVQPAIDDSLFLLPRPFAFIRPSSNTLPTTPGAFEPNCPSPCRRGWAGRISEDLSRLIYGTYLLPSSTAYQVHSDQSLYFVGSPTPDSSYFARLDATGQRLLFNTPLNSSFVSTNPLAVAPDGSAWIPVSEGSATSRSVSLFSPDGSRVLTRIPLVSSILATDAQGRLHAIEGVDEVVRRCGLRYVVHERDGTRLHSLPIPGAPFYSFEAALPLPRLLLDSVSYLFDPNSTPPVVLSCIASPTNFQHLDSVAPGMLLTLFGEGLGPTGTRVFVNGSEAPVLYASPNQVNIAVPFELPIGQPADFEVAASGNSSRPLRVPRSESNRIQLFPVVLNQDGSVNSASNPAASDSVVILWGTGAGNTNPPSTTGEILPFEARPLANPLRVQTSAAFQLEVLYSGAAPGLIAGLTQINVRLNPNAGIRPNQNEFTVVAENTSANITVFVRP